MTGNRKERGGRHERKTKVGREEQRIKDKLA